MSPESPDEPNAVNDQSVAMAEGSELRQDDFSKIVVLETRAELEIQLKKCQDQLNALPAPDEQSEPQRKHYKVLKEIIDYSQLRLQALDLRADQPAR